MWGLGKKISHEHTGLEIARITVQEIKNSLCNGSMYMCSHVAILAPIWAVGCPALRTGDGGLKSLYG